MDSAQVYLNLAGGGFLSFPFFSSSGAILRLEIELTSVKHPNRGTAS